MKGFFKNKKLFEGVQFVAATALVVGLSLHNKMNLPQVLLRVAGFVAVDALLNRLLMMKYHSPYDLPKECAKEYFFRGRVISILSANTDACHDLLNGTTSYKSFKNDTDLDSMIKADLLSLHDAKIGKDLIMLLIAIPLAFSALQTSPINLLQGSLFLGSVAFIKDFISCNFAKKASEPVLLHNNLFLSVMELSLFKGMMAGYEKYAQTFISSNCGAKAAKCVEYVTGFFAAMIALSVKTVIVTKFQDRNAEALARARAMGNEMERN